MASTVKLTLRTSKARSDGAAPIYLRVTKNRKSRFLATGIYIEPQYWNADRQQVRRSHTLAVAFNARLHDVRMEAERLSLEATTAREVKLQLTGTGGMFSDYLAQFIDSLDQTRRFWAWKRYRVVQGKLQACFGPAMAWSDLDLVRFERYLADTLGNGPNTIRKEMALLRSLFGKAVKADAIRADQNPFLRYDLPKAKPPNRRKLSITEVEQLAAVDLAPGTWKATARDAWLISFYLGGMRFGDLAGLLVKDLQQGRCTYRMNKTGRMVSLPVPVVAQRLLAPYLAGKEREDFVLPFLERGDDADPRLLRRRIGSSNALCNRFLKAAAGAAGLAEADMLTMHLARHSFADYARTKSGDLYAISKTLGHASLQITQTYLKSFDQEAVDDLAETLWNG